jgi:hypothetical protein
MQPIGRRDTSGWIADHDPPPIVPLTDPVIDKLGHDVRSSYVEIYWLPILGPSSVWVARRLVGHLEIDTHRAEIGLETFGRSLGLGGGVARNSAVVRSLTRLVDFGMAAIGGTSYAIRPRFPPLAAHHIQRLPAHLVRSHQLEMDAAR